MKQFWLQIVALLIVIFGGLWISINPTALNSLLSSTKTTTPTPIQGGARQTIMITGVSGESKAALNIDVADTDQERALGLGGRSSLDQNSGMLFLFEAPKIPQFWMKGMLIPLDMIWISNDTIVGAAENVPPPNNTPGEVLPIYSPTAAVDKVLEVNAGFVKAHGIMAGDKLKQVQ